MIENKKVHSLLWVLASVILLAIFIIPLLFVVFNAGMSSVDAAKLIMRLPAPSQYLQNFIDVINAADRMIIRAFMNSTIITVFSVLILVAVASMASFVLSRRTGLVKNISMFLFLTGLMIPPSVVTTLWVLRSLNLYKTLPGIILIEVALGLPFALILFNGFMNTLPKELDEAAFIDGASTGILFTQIIFPLLKPVSVTVLVLSSVNIFNDFVNPLYFLPGAKNATIQLTLYNFMSRYSTQWNLLFMNVLIITIPPLIVFIFLHRQIVGGMVAGAVKG